MRNDFKDYARTFCQLFLPLFANTGSTYSMSMGSTKQLTAIFINFGLFVLLGPIGCTNISRVVTISKIPDVQQNVIHK